MGAPGWLVPGAKAVILQPYARHLLRAEHVTVERVLKRDVVLSNGDRFPVARLQRQVGGSWGTTYYLVPPTDERIDETRRAINLSRLRADADRAYDTWRRDKANPQAVVDAFTALVDHDTNPTPTSPEATP